MQEKTWLEDKEEKEEERVADVSYQTIWDIINKNLIKDGWSYLYCARKLMWKTGKLQDAKQDWDKQRQNNNKNCLSQMEISDEREMFVD